MDQPSASLHHRVGRLFWTLLVPLSLVVTSQAGAWFFTLPATRPTAARDVAIAPSGTIVAAGEVAFTNRIFSVWRFDPSTGLDDALYFHDPLTDGRAHALALRGEDAIAVGETASPASAAEFLVTRSDANGAEVWATELHGTASCGDDVAFAVAVDPAGDVVAGGQVTNTVGQADATALVVVKLGGSDGAVLWRTEIPDGVARALTVDGQGDVVAAGTVAGAFTVVKLAGASGQIQWQVPLGAGDALAVFPGDAGVVYAAGQLGGVFQVAKLDTDTGASSWPAGHGQLAGTGVARALVRLGAGDVVAAGELGAGATRTLVTARFADGDGDVVWEDAGAEVPQPSAAYGVARDALDQVVSVGTAADPTSPASFASRSIFGTNGALAWNSGLLSDDPETRALAVRIDAAGDVVIAGQYAFFGLAPSFAVQKLDGETGDDFVAACGNGTLDPGEECDDGNTFEGDCCSPTCTFEPADQPCVDDGEACTSDRCDGAGTCLHAPVPDATPCDDLNDCTTGDACASGQCVGANAQPGTACDDFNPCTDDTCDGAGHCVPQPNTAPCNDFNPCTTNDTCAAGFCKGTPTSGSSCDDFKPCTTGDVCQNGVCQGVPTPGASCSSDGNPCTDDVCSPQGFCTHVPNAAPCDDANACTAGDHCEAGECVGGAAGTTTTTSTTTSSSTSTTTSSSTAPSTTTSSTSTTTVPTTTSSTSSTSSPIPTTTTTSTTAASTTTTTSTSTSTVTLATTTSTTSSSTPTTTAPPSTTSSSTTTTPATSSSTTTTTLGACTTAADCDDGDPCNGREGCVDGRCLAPRAAGSAAACTGPDAIAIVTSFDGDSVAFINVRTRTVEATIGVGRSPWGVAWQPDGARVFVTNRESRSVSVIDVAARNVVATIPVGKEPLGIAVHPFLPRAYVALYDEDRVAVIDTASLAVVDGVGVGNGPSGIAVHPAGGDVYVANYIAGTVSVIDAATTQVVATVTTPALPVGLAVHPGGTKVYVACLKARELAVLGTVSHTLLDTVRVGRRPIGVAFDAAGAHAYVANSGDDTVTVLDAANDRVTAKIPVGKAPLGVAVTDAGALWIANSRANALTIVDGDATATVTVPGTPVAIGGFIGTPPGDCPTAPLPCDDANPFTGDACRAGVGCAQEPIAGVAGVRAGTSALAAIADAMPDDPVVAALRDRLPDLESAVAAAETGGDRSALRLARRTLKPILTTLEAARRHGTLGGEGARLLDIARETRRELGQLARHGGR